MNNIENLRNKIGELDLNNFRKMKLEEPNFKDQILSQLEKMGKFDLINKIKEGKISIGLILKQSFEAGIAAENAQGENFDYEKFIELSAEKIAQIFTEKQ